MAILVDTGAWELLRRRDRRVETLAIRFYPPIICDYVAGELLFGQAKAKVSAAAFQAAREFVESFEVLQPSIATASTYARLWTGLETKGIRLPDPDLWIAAHALENRLPLDATSCRETTR